MSSAATAINRRISAEQSRIDGSNFFGDNSRHNTNTQNINRQQRNTQNINQQQRGFTQNTNHQQRNTRNINRQQYETRNINQQQRHTQNTNQQQRNTQNTTQQQRNTQNTTQQQRNTQNINRHAPPVLKGTAVQQQWQVLNFHELRTNRIEAQVHELTYSLKNIKADQLKDMGNTNMSQVLERIERLEGENVSLRQYLQKFQKNQNSVSLNVEEQ